MNFSELVKKHRIDYFKLNNLIYPLKISGLLPKRDHYVSRGMHIDYTGKELELINAAIKNRGNSRFSACEQAAMSVYGEESVEHIKYRIAVAGFKRARWRKAKGYFDKYRMP